MRRCTGARAPLGPRSNLSGRTPLAPKRPTRTSGAAAPTREPRGVSGPLTRSGQSQKQHPSTPQDHFSANTSPPQAPRHHQLLLCLPEHKSRFLSCTRPPSSFPWNRSVGPFATLKGQFAVEVKLRKEPSEVHSLIQTHHSKALW